MFVKKVTDEKSIKRLRAQLLEGLRRGYTIEEENRVGYRNAKKPMKRKVRRDRNGNWCFIPDADRIDGQPILLGLDEGNQYTIFLKYKIQTQESNSRSFFVKKGDRYFAAHSGAIGSGRGTIDGSTLRGIAEDNKFEIACIDKPENRVILISEINSKDISKNFKRLINLIRGLKEKQFSIAPKQKDCPLDDKSKKTLKEEIYNRVTPAKVAKIIPRHNMLSNSLKQWLEACGGDPVSQEVKGVDVRCRLNERECLFEVKITQSQSVRLAVRDAVGQILDYSYGPDRIPPHHAAIVIDVEPSPDIERWFRTLKRHYIPIELMWLKNGQLYTAGITNHPLLRFPEVRQSDD